MAIYGYTKNYKLIKPKYDTDTWHDYEYDNLDTIDAVLSAIYASGNWKGFWATNTAYVVGDVVIDRDTDTMYKVMFDHTTSSGSFAAEQTAHPDYYELWSPNNLAESWAIKTDSKVSNTDYSAKAYAISSGLIDDGSAKEWAVGSGAIGNTNEYSAKKYATDAHNDYINMTTNANVVAVGSNINNVNVVGQSISNVNTVAGDISSVNTVAGVSTDVTAVASIASSVPTVANNDANITTVATNISDVNTAATNIEAIKDAYNNANTAQTMATQAAQSASEAAQSATDSATSASNSHIWAEGTDAQVQALGGVHSSKVWAQQSTNANIALTNSPYTTNRILEIPQDIKLELNNGTLTLKAGSKVYVPNGPGVFDVITVPNDVTASTFNNSKQMHFYHINGRYFERCDITNIFSGSTAPSNVPDYSMWYDTSTNKMKRYINGSWNEDSRSLPICIATSSTTEYTSIDQIFNGFGYIGSTVFALPGVKVQYPNGKNEYGTCNSGIIVNSKVNLWSATGTAYVDIVLLQNGIFGYTKTNLFYDSEKNIVKHKNGSIIYGTTIASCWNKDTVISDFLRYDVDSVVNSNASNFSQTGRSYLSGLSMPSGKYIDLTLGASGSTYTAPANGYVAIGGPCSGYISLYNDTGKLTSMLVPDNGNYKYARTFVPVSKGNVFGVDYVGLTVEIFRFIYAQGEQ